MSASGTSMMEAVHRAASQGYDFYVDPAAYQEMVDPGVALADAPSTIEICS